MANLGKNTGIKSNDTNYVTMFVENGIFYMCYKSLELLEINIAKTIVQDRLAFKKGIFYPSLFDIREVKQSTKEARDYMANEGNDLVLASAILVSSPVLRMMANFYIMVNKPKNPTRMFTDKDGAVEWLNQFKSQF